MNTLQPSETLNQTIDCLAAKLRNGTYLNSPDWMVQAAALTAAFRFFKKSNELHVLFDFKNPYDCSMLVWCIEADHRERSENGKPIAPGLADTVPSPAPVEEKTFVIPLPSENLRTLWWIFENHLRLTAPAGHAQWELMAAALHTAYVTFEKSDRLAVLFDSNNPFDQTMRLWCLEMERRKTEDDKMARATAARN
jgi:hypothetical protein